jgi:hypothetical protein
VVLARRRFSQIAEEFDGNIIHAFSAVRENQDPKPAVCREPDEAAESSRAPVVPDHGLLEPLALGADPVHAKRHPLVLLEELAMGFDEGMFERLPVGVHVGLEILEHIGGGRAQRARATQIVSLEPRVRAQGQDDRSAA